MYVVYSKLFVFFVDFLFTYNKNLLSPQKKQKHISYHNNVLELDLEYVALVSYSFAYKLPGNSVCSL